jgi:hypothetical protein
MSEYQLTLVVLPDTFAVCRLNPDAGLPDWAFTGAFSSITRTAAELSIVCPQILVPADVKCESDWRCLQVAGTLDFSLTGIMAALTSVLAEAGISIFVISTFDTDYLLVKADKLENAIKVLSAAGHRVTI